MAMQTTSNNSEGEPMMEMNTTPLIDVMLVLIIMLIITIPPQTHAVKLDLPQGDSPPHGASSTRSRTRSWSRRATPFSGTAPR